MKTNWRELRESLATGDPFSTFSTFSHKTAGDEEKQFDGEDGVVKSVDSVKSSKTVNNHFGEPKVNRVKSAERRYTDASNSWEWILELAAIFEFDGGMDRDEANTKAFMCWYRHFVEGQ